MRNPDLDKTLPEDNKISDPHKDDKGIYKLINGKKIYQIEEKNQKDRDMNLIINRVRASGMTPFEYLNKGN